jgi:hypothetical protein
MSSRRITLQGRQTLPMPGDPEWEAAHSKQTRRSMSKKQAPAVQPKAAAKVGPKTKKRARATSIPPPIESPLDLTTESIPAMQYKKLVFFDKLLLSLMRTGDGLLSRTTLSTILSGDGDSSRSRTLSLVSMTLGRTLSPYFLFERGSSTYSPGYLPLHHSFQRLRYCHSGLRSTQQPSFAQY